MYLKKANAGTIFKTNTGKLTIGLVVYDIAIVRNEKNEPGSPPYKLIQIRPGSNWSKTLCGLFLKQASTKSYYQGDINLGFGIMRVQLWKNENPKSEKSPTIYITAQLLTEAPKQNNIGSYSSAGDISEQAFGNSNQQGYTVVYEEPNTAARHSAPQSSGPINLDEDDIPF